MSAYYCCTVERSTELSESTHRRQENQKKWEDNERRCTKDRGLREAVFEASREDDPSRLQTKVCFQRGGSDQSSDDGREMSQDTIQSTPSKPLQEVNGGVNPEGNRCSRARPAVAANSILVMRGKQRNELGYMKPSS